MPCSAPSGPCCLSLYSRMSAFNVPAATTGEVECTATASTCGPTTLVVTDVGPSAFTTWSESERSLELGDQSRRPPPRARVVCQIALERSALADLDPEVARRQQLVEHDLRLCRGRLGDACEIGALGDRRGLWRRVVEPECGRRLVLLGRPGDEPDGDEHRGERQPEEELPVTAVRVAIRVVLLQGLPPERGGRIRGAPPTLATLGSLGLRRTLCTAAATDHRANPCPIPGGTGMTVRPGANKNEPAVSGARRGLDARLSLCRYWLIVPLDAPYCGHPSAWRPACAASC